MQDPMPQDGQQNLKIIGRPRWLEQAQRGQGLVEYALALVLVGMAGSVSLVIVGPAINEALCEAIETLNPDLGDNCTSGETEELSSGPTNILFAKYNAGKGELDVQAKAPSSCHYDLQIMVDGVYKGTMSRQGSSYVFKYTGNPSTLPSNVQVGHPECGGFSSSPVS